MSGKSKKAKKGGVSLDIPDETSETQTEEAETQTVDEADTVTETPEVQDDPSLQTEEVDDTPEVKTIEPEQAEDEEFHGQGGRYISMGGGKRKRVPAEETNA